MPQQLAKVVEGWKKRESEKDEFIKVLSQEKEQVEETLQKQQKVSTFTLHFHINFEKIHNL